MQYILIEFIYSTSAKFKIIYAYISMYFQLPELSIPVIMNREETDIYNLNGFIHFADIVVPYFARSFFRKVHSIVSYIIH